MAVPAKILEKCLLTIIKPDLLKAYDENQFGFRPGYSASLATLILNEKVQELLDKNDIIAVQVVNYDISKAFDSVNHDH